MTLGIGVVLDARRTPGPGERRFLAALADDPRFALSFVAEAAGGPQQGGPVARVMAAEARLFRAPDRAPTDVPEPVALPAALPKGCDVVVDFSLSDQALALGETAPHGVLRLSAHATGAGHREALERAPVTSVALTRHRAGTEDVLATARYDTKFLATRNAALIREKSAQLVLRTLAELTQGAAHRPAPFSPSNPLTPADLPRYAARVVSELAVRGFNSLRERLHLRPGLFELRLGSGDGLSFDPTTTTPLRPPPGAFWADPFLFEHDGALYLFYEAYDYSRKLGHLEVARVDGDALTPLGPVMHEPHHLSYPFVFRWDGAIWMIPETHQTKRLELWRATDFPTGWELVKTAFDGTLMADTTLFEHDGQWWLFTNICQDSFNDFEAELSLFKIDSPMLNEITPHPLNPVVIDTTCARNGGRVFAHDGKIYRTSQDNSHGVYGYGLNVMEITQLDMAGYSERRMRHVTGGFDEGLGACHQMDAAAGRFVIDVRRKFLRARGWPS